MIAAAATCYSSGGRDAMTIAKICEQAGVSVGTVYHHFRGGVPELEGVLYLDTLANYQGGYLATLHSRMSAQEGVKSSVLFHLKWIATDLSRAQYLLFFSPSWLSSEHYARLEEMNREFVQATRAWRRPYVRAGDIREMPDAYYGPVVLGPAQQLASNIITHSNPADVPRALRRAGPALAEAAWLAVKAKH